MTVSASGSRRVQYTATGATTGPFAVAFPFFEIAVYIDGVLRSSAEYTITQPSPGQNGDVNFLVAPVGELVILGATNRAQSIDFISSDTVKPEQAELGLDRLTMIAQEVETALTGSIRVEVGEGIVPTAIPAGADGFIRIDPLGNVTIGEAVDGSDLTFASEAAELYSTLARKELFRPSTGGIALKEVWPTDALFVAMLGRGLIGGVAGGAPSGGWPNLWLDTSGGSASPSPWKYYNGASWITATGGIVAEAIVARGFAGSLNVGLLNASHIADDAVTNAELANMAANRIKGSVTSGDPVDLTPAQVRAIAVSDGVDATKVMRGDGTVGNSPGGQAIGFTLALAAAVTATDRWTADLGDPGSEGVSFDFMGGGKDNLTGTDTFQVWVSLDGGTNYTALGGGAVNLAGNVAVYNTGNAATWAARIQAFGIFADTSANISRGAGNVKVQLRRVSGATVLTTGNSFFRVTRSG